MAVIVAVMICLYQLAVPATASWTIVPIYCSGIDPSRQAVHIWSQPSITRSDQLLGFQVDQVMSSNVAEHFVERCSTAGTLPLGVGLLVDVVSILEATFALL